VFTGEAVDGFPILELAQQGRKAVGLVIQRKHCLMNDRKSRTACLSQRPSLGNPILEYGQLLSFRAISLEIICDRIGVSKPHEDACSRDEPQLRHQDTHLHLTKKVIRRSRPEEKHVKSTKRLNFIALPRFSISPRRNRSASAASEAFERATSTLAVTLFNSC
jgi:hypothetical protein